ncbi:DALR anticodon-binding domain-containing protein [Streptomyces sp. NPDC005907]|uniref:DALR anticodon-binding domain-containing protein n=1 Tax=Streptomyces sp. NPDC005907 TaxID=3154571 RepID=UPI0033F1A304
MRGPCRPCAAGRRPAGPDRTAGPPRRERAARVRRRRLWLTDASRVVLRNGLHLLGVSAPERM